MAGFSDRVLWAIQELERVERKRKIENSEIGRRVAEKMGREEPYRSQSVGRWLEESEPGLDVIVGLAEVLGVDPGWLAFGEASKAPAPSGYDATHQSPTESPTRRAANGAAVLRRFDASQKAAAAKAAKERRERRKRG